MTKKGPKPKPAVEAWKFELTDLARKHYVSTRSTGITIVFAELVHCDRLSTNEKRKLIRLAKCAGIKNVVVKAMKDRERENKKWGRK